ncbi:hypothetical protein ACFQT0_14725 [Hymenobacter humi]|uniref:Uncharacterized protein n=1 Tax=Hymenobacter humi TaxID=1411620 RepID=A0ABW2U8R3_9BACT
MFSPAKTIVVLLVSLVLAAALLTLPTGDALPRQMRFTYNLFYSVVFGWAFYVPFVAAYAAAARRWQLTPWSAPGLGLVLAAGVTSPVWASPSFPAFSGVRFFDGLGWAVGGACYALLHHFWIVPSRSR